MIKQRVSVRALAEFALESGDLVGGVGAMERMQEGSLGHRLRQNAYTEGFRSEVPVHITRVVNGVELTVYGRIDGFKADPPIVEEIKTTRLPVSMIGENSYPVHWGQAELYAFIVSAQEEYNAVELRLVYRHVSGDTRVFTRSRTRAQLESVFVRLAAPYADWCMSIALRQQANTPTIKALPFPYDGYREGQYAMAKECYLSMKNGHNLLCQAPTGIGKTAAVLFAALKALGEGRITQIFYLTARGTTRKAAEDALDRMRNMGLKTQSILITAKEKICPMQKARCAPDLCPLAAGYYDKRRDALKEGMRIERLTVENVSGLAARYSLCPFELQLDLSESADVVICDYNYAFDPKVRLKRFFLTKSKIALLVDEAHNLTDRAREMLSASIEEKGWKALSRELRAVAPKDAPLFKAVAGVLTSIRGYRGVYEKPGFEEEAPEDLAEALEIFLEEARPYLSDTALGSLLSERYFEALDFTRVAAQMDGSYRAVYDFSGEPGAKGIKLLCVNPARRLRETYQKVQSAILFSATLSPMQYYRDMLGLEEEEGDTLINLPSPFPNENFLVLRMPINVRYQHRAENTRRIALAIAEMCRAKTGNYLVCFPSYAYLRMMAPEIQIADPGLEIICQRPGMDEGERAAFLQMFSEDRAHSMAALIVMGGLFSEGIDLPGERLSGAAILSVGMPLPSFERYVIAASLNEDGMGTHYAYTYPGIERVLQAAGRVIRTENDRGTALLIDERYMEEFYEELMPSNWNLRTVKTLPALQKALQEFWK